MLILTDYNKPYMIENLLSPVVPKHYWIFSGQMQDFMLAPISYLEETSGPTLTIEVDGFKFNVPAHWNILIIDHETYQIDTVPIRSCSSHETYAFIMTPEDYGVNKKMITVCGYKNHEVLCHPLMAKGQALCHPIGEVTKRGKDLQLAVVITPHDLNKFIDGKAVGDILP